MVFLIEWGIKIHAKGELYWIVGLKRKKNHPCWGTAGCGVFSVSLSHGGTETPVCCCSVLPRFGNLPETLWETYCLQAPLFVSLWYADKPDIKRGSHGDQKEPTDTVQRWGAEGKTINVESERNSNLPWHKLTRLHEAKLIVYKELIHEDQNIKVFKGYSVIGGNAGMHFTLYCARIIPSGHHGGDANAELLT